MRRPQSEQRDNQSTAHARDATSSFADAVRFYLQLTPRQLPSRFLYDALGSSLFDAICHLPWYQVTRAEYRLLARYAADIGRIVGRHARVVELGSGNGEKLALLLRHANILRVQAHLIDLSETALARATQALAAVEEVDVTVNAERTTYEEGLLALPEHGGVPTLLAFLGSNIGNFDPPGATAFLQLIRAALQAGDFLLLGADLIKPESELLLAYDDPLGLTTVFNKNLLLRINTELGGDFQLDRFAHRAVWNAEESRIEMHLVSLAKQRVVIPGAEVRFTLEARETIWTESSYKYEPSKIVEQVEQTGFALRQQWIDAEAAFALTLFEAV